jgi:hypothetical protein
MAYNALDNQKTAADLRQQLILERDDIRASLEYNEATGGQNWTYSDSELVEIELNIIAKLIAALGNYLKE